jgi:hypothetical protein
MVGISTEDHYQWLWEVYLQYGEIKRIFICKRPVGMFGGRESVWRSFEYTPPEIEGYVRNSGKMIGRLYIPTKDTGYRNIPDVS